LEKKERELKGLLSISPAKKIREEKEKIYG